MSKVLVDRELLERCVELLDLLPESRTIVGVRAILAQPAEAEGVEVVAFQVRRTAWGTTSNLYTEKLPFVPGEGVTQYSEPTALIRLSDHLAALSAVTAERDDLRLQVEAARSVCTESQGAILGLIAERDQLRAEVEMLREDAERWRYVSLQGDDTHWLNLLRVDLEDFGGNINAAVDALIDGEAPAMAAKEA